MSSSIRTALFTGALACALYGAAGHAQQKPAAAPAPAAGQPPAKQDQAEPAPNQPQQPVFRSGINFVRVDVIVSDKAGASVDDLKQADFEVTEDGKSQSIETFKLVKLDGGTAESLEHTPRAIRTDYDEETEAGRDDVRLFAVFLDDYHVRKGASLGVREPLGRFVETQLGPSDMIGMMYPLDPLSTVRMTRNHEAIAKGVRQFTGRKFDYTPRNYLEEKYANYPAETVEQIRNQVSMSAIKGLIIHMGTLKEGRKALILVSEGYTSLLPPQMRDPIASMPGYGNPSHGDPMAGVGDMNEDRAQWMSGMDMQIQLREIYDTANRNNVAIYAVDPRGLSTGEFDIDQNINMTTSQDYLNSTMDTLRVLSDQTDGRAIVNRNDLGAGMRQITRDSNAYYLIGYNSSLAPQDGRFHEIKVRVKRPGVQVRARRGYWALNPEEAKRATAPPKPPTAPAVEAALAIVNTPSHARVVRTWVGTSRGANGRTKVTFVWEPVARSAADSGRREEPARVSLMALGEDGSAYFRGRVPDVALASAAPQATAVNGSAPRAPSRVTFDVPPGRMQLRVSVEGSSAQVLDSEMQELTVPDLTAPQPTISTPEVLRARNARELLQLKADPDPVPTAGREFARSDRLLIRVPVYGPGNDTPALSVHLLNRLGQPMSELPVAPFSPGGPQQIEVPLAGLAPGEYVVEIKTAGQEGDAGRQLVGFRVTG